MVERLFVFAEDGQRAGDLQLRVVKVPIGLSILHSALDGLPRGGVVSFFRGQHGARRIKKHLSGELARPSLDSSLRAGEVTDTQLPDSRTVTRTRCLQAF